MQTVVVIGPATAGFQPTQHFIETVVPRPRQRHRVRHDLDTLDAAVLLHVEVRLAGVDVLHNIDHVATVVVPDLQLTPIMVCAGSPFGR